MAEKGIEQKSFEHDLAEAGELVQGIYFDLLAKRRSELVKEHGGPVNVPLDERRRIFGRARIRAQYGNADPEEMAQRWESYDKPPTGGSQD